MKPCKHGIFRNGSQRCMICHKERYSCDMCKIKVVYRHLYISNKDNVLKSAQLICNKCLIKIVNNMFDNNKFVKKKVKKHG